MKPKLCRAACSTVAIVAIAGSISGCSTTEGTVALTAGTILGGTYLGAQLLTHSNIDVEVEVFNQEYPKGLDPAHFKQKDSLAITELAQGVTVDPAVEGSKDNFLQVAQSLMQIMDSLDQTQASLRSAAKNIAPDAEPPKTDQPPKAEPPKTDQPPKAEPPKPDQPPKAEPPKPDQPPKAEPPKADQPHEDTVFRRTVSAELLQLADQSKAAVQAFREYQKILKNATADRSGFDTDQAPALMQKIKEIRDRLSSRDGFRFSANAMGLIRLELQGAVMQLQETQRLPDWHDVMGRMKDQMERTKPSVEVGAAEQVAPFAAVVVDAIMTSTGNDDAKNLTLDSLVSTLGCFGLRSSTAALRSDYVPGNLKDTATAIAATLSTAGLTKVGGHVAEVVRQQKLAFNATFIKIQTDFNLGAIRNEVMQTLLTSDAIPDITLPANSSHWQRFSHAWSRGTTGNHDAIIYFEHLGMPILKSAGFDPTKFVVANGQMFRKAFSAMAAVYGVPAPGATTDKDTGKTLLSYNMSLAEQSRQESLKAADDSQAQIIAALEKIAADGEKAVKDTSNNATDIRKKADDLLDAAIKSLAKPEAKAKK